MKLSPNRSLAREGLWCRTMALPQLAVAIGGFLCLPAFAQVRPTHRADIPNFDKRAVTNLPASFAPEVQAAKARLTAQLPTVSVEFDPLLRTPKFIRASDGFLTGPNGEGRGVSATTRQALAANDPYQAIRGFLNEHSDLFGHNGSVLDAARAKRDYVDAHNGLHTVVLEQQLDGIPLYQGILISHTTKLGELVSLSSTFIPNPASAADAGTPGRGALQGAPPISVSDALAAASRNIGGNLSAREVVSVAGAELEGGYQQYQTPEPAFARLVWLPMNRASLRLAWEVMVTSHATKERFRLVIDAQSGEPYLREALSSYLADATFNVYTSDSPSPFTPSLQTPGTFQPPLTNRLLITFPAFDTNASPAGWIDDTNNTTTGNNVDAFVDRNFDQQPDRPRPVGNPARTFDFPLDLTQDPTNYIDASTVQLFYRANLYHDKLYELGFTEAAGNYQENNFGRGGIGGDNIICYVQSGADVGIGDNSFFSAAPDGFHGQCFMFVFTGPNPQRDGSLDQEVVTHELTHGTSWRLVGGGMTLGSLQGNGMGEGWSDFCALGLLGDRTDNPRAAYAMGGYVTYLFAGTGLLQNYYYGIRHFPYCTDMTKNPFTFKDIDPAQISPHTGVPRSPLYPFDPTEANEVHHSGEVWCVTLWEMHANLVAKYGWVVGNQLTLQLVIDGMKLTPPLPNFLQARDAILLADRIDNGGQNVSEIWRAFAKRGMGVSASSPDGSTTAGVVEAFDVPGLSIDRVLVLGGNGNGILDINECDQFQIALFNNSGFDATGISARLSTSTKGVLVTQPFSPYPIIPNGGTNFNSTPFSVSIAPTFICGTPVNFNLVVKSDQGTYTNRFVLPTGTNGPPLRFDNFAATPIPDNGTTNSIIVVSNVDFAITRMTVSLYLTHTFDSDLIIRLVSPDGLTNTLSRQNGANGHNYGLACGPDSLRTTFDDAAVTNPIANATAPFVGTFQPQQPLARFAGKSGTTVNGPWQLVISDVAPQDVGTLQCWSLSLTPTFCLDGGGECPGADLAVGMVAAPEPVIVGANLTYLISVTNNGPSTAKSVSVSQVLPSGVIFVSATASQGSVAQNGGVVTANLGLMPAGATATVSVIVVPTAVGSLTSSATASSEQPDFNQANNTAVVFSTVNPPTADLGIGLIASPPAVVVGGNLSYTVSVTNNGPSAASGVIVTNLFPPGLVFLGETVSQGSIAIYSNTVVWTIGSLTNAAVAQATINVAPTAQGSFVVSSSVIGNQADPVAGNNTATASVTVGPAADLALGLVALPNPVVLSSNVTLITSVTNNGPSFATSVTVNQNLPTGAAVVSTTLSQGTYTLTGTNLVCALGTLNPGASATVTVVVKTSKLGFLTSVSSVQAAETDPNPANNSAAVSITVASPFVNIAAAGASITSESLAPPNGSIDIGETVTLQFRLQNQGNVANTNLVATLLATGGVTAPSGPQTYGIIKPIGVPGGVPVSRPFTFTAVGTNGGSIVATLQLQDGGTSLSPVVFTFALPTVASFTNNGGILIPDPNAMTTLDSGPAAPYPSTNVVSGISAQVGRVTASLYGLTHTFPHDISALLVSPAGSRTLLLSHAADQSSVDNATVTFDDAAASPIPAVGSITSGSWQPSAYSPAPVFSNPAPAGPYSAAMSTFNGVNPNGTWSLYVLDDGTGDSGNIANGWSLTFTNVSPVNQIADLGLTGVASAGPYLAGGLLTYTFTVANAGPDGATGVTFSNALPAGVLLVSASASQGNTLTNGSLVLGNLGNLASGSNATITIVVQLTTSAVGSLANVASVSAFETDLHLADNTAQVNTAVTLPVADLSLSIAASSPTLIVRSNLTYSIAVTNNGPGTALAVMVTNRLPAGVTFGSATASQGSVSLNSGTVAAALGDIASGAFATITLNVIPQNAGLITDSASASTLSLDNVSANNTASVTVEVDIPAPHIVASGATLVSVGQSPSFQGSISPGQTVTILFGLANIGVLDTANLVATLQNSGGVTAPSGPATYGVVVAGGPVVSRAFTFTVNPAAAGALVATLHLQDGSGNLGNVSFTFGLPVTTTLNNNNAINIPDHGVATPYPSVINVSGLTGYVTQATVTLHGLTHSFASDVNVLLVSPDRHDVLLMSHAGGGSGVTNVTLTFDDAASTTLPNTTAITGGTYLPSKFGAPVTFPPSAPPAPYGSALANLFGSVPNGSWSLYVLDDSVGDSGVIAGGWTLSLTTVLPVSPVADLALGMTGSPASLFTGDTLTYNFALTNLGPNPVTGVVVTDPLPFGINFVSATVSQGTTATSANNVTWNVGTLSAGATASLSMATIPSLGGSFVNIASVTGNNTDFDPANNSASTSTFVTTLASAVLTGSLTNGQLHLNIAAQPNQTYVIQASVNLSTWVSISTNTAAADGTIHYTDPNSPSIQTRFYRTTRVGP